MHILPISLTTAKANLKTYLSEPNVFLGGFNTINTNLKNDTVHFSSNYEKNTQKTTPLGVLKVLRGFEKTDTSARELASYAKSQANTILNTVQDDINSAIETSKRIYDEANISPFQPDYTELMLSDNSSYISTRTISRPYGNFIVVQDGITNDGLNSSTERKIYYSNGMPVIYLEGVSTGTDGSKHISKKIEFSNGKPMAYYEGLTITQDSQTSAKYVEFQDGQPYLCMINQQKNPIFVKYDEAFSFDNGELTKYTKNSFDTKKIAKSKAKTFTMVDYKDGQMISYKEEKQLPDSYGKRQIKTIKYADEVPVLYKQGNNKASNKDEQVSRVLEFKDGMPHKIYQGSFNDVFYRDITHRKYVFQDNQWVNSASLL